MRKQIKVQTDQALIYAKVVELAKLLIANRSLHLLADEHWNLLEANNFAGLEDEMAEEGVDVKVLPDKDDDEEEDFEAPELNR